MDTIEVAKIYLRSIVAILCLTTGVMFGAYLGQITEYIWAAWIIGVGGCVYMDKPVVPIA
jgi:hypothetical protein